MKTQSEGLRVGKAATIKKIEPIDFQALVRELQRFNWTFPDIAEYMECSPSTVSAIAQGQNKNPTGNAAIRLYYLHVHVTKKRGRVPRRPIALSS
jgi:transcriptional regulator with XRE-family HTH domain